MNAPIDPHNPDDSTISGAGHASEQTRRTFIKRAGAGTIITPAVFARLASSSALADEPSPSAPTVTATIPTLGIDIFGFRAEMVEVNSPIDWHYGQNQPMTLPHDSAGNGTPPNELTCQATTNPKSLAALVQLRVKTGESDASTVQITNPGFDGNASTGVVKFKIRAVSASATELGATIEAFWNDPQTGAKTTKAGNAAVRIPASFQSFVNPGDGAEVPETIFDADVNAETLTMHAQFEAPVVKPELQPGQTYTKYPFYSTSTTIKVFDQFNKPLPGCYSGTAVQENSIWIQWMSGSNYEDRVGLAPNKSSVTYLAQGAGEIYSSSPPQGGSPSADVKVAGHAIGIVARSIQATAASGATTLTQNGKTFPNKIRLKITW